MKLSFERYVDTELVPTSAAHEKPNILLLTCIDYRYAHRIVDVMDSRQLRRKYDIFSLAGAAAGANKFAGWRQTLGEHIVAARDVGHPIDRVVILEHRDCGAYRLFFGLEWDQVTPPEEERAHLREVLALSSSLRGQFGRELVIDSILLARDEDDVLEVGTNVHPEPK